MTYDAASAGLPDAHDGTPEGSADAEGRSADDGLIQPLSDTLASKIAAGEVVQRPANALKELVENALDAGASSIDVVLRKAGSELIQVTDDGCGMGPRDAEAAFGRHATSKLRAFSDLDRLRTLGFRGEAMASIASVARVELRTKRRQDPAGTCVRVAGGALEGVQPCAAPDGTHIAVRTLFYNVPARRAFLKTPATEFKHLVEIFQALALSHPEVAFTLTHDDTEVYRLRGEATLAERLADLHGADLAGQLLPVREQTSYLSVRGVVGQPGAARRSRGGQYLFVNGRYVRSRSLDHAVAQAYGGLLPEGRFPLSALFLDVDPRHVDVNVHPTKTEVKFDDDNGVYTFLRSVVKKGLAETGSAIAFDTDAVRVAPPPAPELGSGRSFALDRGPAAPPTVGGPPAATPPPLRTPSPFPFSSVPDLEADRPPARSSVMPPAPRGPILSRSAPLDADGAEVERDASPERTIWQLHNRFLLSPVRSGLLIVDQQAAHERILYERALAAIEGGLAPSQQLLFPFPVDLPADDRALIDQIAPDLRALGFDLVVPPDGSPVLVRGVPADVTLGDEREALADLVAQFRRNEALLGLGARENLARSLARRSAVKPGQALGPLEARTIIDQLFGCAEPFSAPGGRPTMVRLSEEEIDQRFRR